MFKNALVSVSDKTGLKDFLAPLVKKGLRVVSTGGTAKYLKENAIPVIEVSEQTGFPEVMDGRVRTLHPKIHMSLLARLENSQDMALMQDYKIEPFDLVIGNLYPFEEYKNKNLSDRELTEYIDIGGPALLRAAAKNYEQITVICDPLDYKKILEGGTTLELRKELAAKLFFHISSYDAMIARQFSADILRENEISFGTEVIQSLRYGENPQQRALWLKGREVSYGLHHAKILQGKALSYNNLLDIDNAADLCFKFQNPCCVAVKHNNPCGVAIGKNLLEATQRALKADPVSVFGGIVALNQNVTIEIAKELSKIFLECIVAPSYSSEALNLFLTKKNLRILEYDPSYHKREYELRTISGGYLLQSSDQVCSVWNSDWKIYGEKPSEEIKKDLLFAWQVCASLKSNAIAIVENELSLGLGMGQVSRIDSVHQAIQRMNQYHKGIQRPVLASDAFFPFSDSIEVIAQHNIFWVIQPGGSIKDEEVIAAAKRLGVNLVLTGVRHFRH